MAQNAMSCSMFLQLHIGSTKTTGEHYSTGHFTGWYQKHPAFPNFIDFMDPTFGEENSLLYKIIVGLPNQSFMHSCYLDAINFHAWHAKPTLCTSVVRQVQTCFVVLSLTLLSHGYHITMTLM